MPLTNIDERAHEVERAEQYRALVEYGLTAGIGVGHSLGITLEAIGAGRAVWTMQPSTRAADAHYSVASGVLATLMEAAMASAVHAALPPRTTYTAAGLSIALVGKLRVGDPEVCCEAHVVHCGNRTATADARVMTADGRLVAHGGASFLVFPVPQG